MTQPTLPRSICVFCGSSSAVDAHYFDLAKSTGKAIADKDYQLVYGGGAVGLMGATAKAAFEAGGDVLGIIPRFLLSKEVVYEDVPHTIVEDMHTRKQIMYDRADAFIVLPGGIGTLEEAVEVMSWLRMKLHSKPVVFLDTDDYWAPIIELFTHTIDARFTPEWMRNYLFRATDIHAAIAMIDGVLDDPEHLAAFEAEEG